MIIVRKDRRRRHNAPPLPRAQEPGEGEPVPHGRLRVPAALPRHRDGAARLHVHRDDAAVHRLAHHVRAHEGHPQGRAQHVLLDPPDVHAELGALEARRRRRAAPGRRQDEGRAGQEARQVLPVGRLLPILPGRIALTLGCVDSSFSHNIGLSRKHTALLETFPHATYIDRCPELPF